LQPLSSLPNDGSLGEKIVQNENLYKAKDPKAPQCLPEKEKVTPDTIKHFNML